MTFEDLKNANAEIKTLNIHGAEYVPVSERIKAFRRVCPGGTITTEFLHYDDKAVVIKATVQDETGKILGTGTGREEKGLGNVNKTSYVENCETSAVGRALGMAGIGVDASFASADEMVNALAQQEQTASSRSLDGFINTLPDSATSWKAQAVNFWKGIGGTAKNMPEQIKAQTGTEINKDTTEEQWKNIYTLLAAGKVKPND